MTLFDMPDIDTIFTDKDPALSQWFTPEWVASLLVERYFPALTSQDLVIEPACGLGAFVKAIPEDVPVIGVEIDPDLATKARENTGRLIISDDFAKADLPDGVTAIVGNPPFVLDVVEQFLDRAHRILPKAGRCGFLMPTYHFQTYGRVNRWSQRWGLQTDMIPRGIFPGIKLPLAFAIFEKDARHTIGLALYAEAAAIANLRQDAQQLLRDGRRQTSVWRALVRETLEALGGQATLEQLYRHIEPRRPTATAFWREKVRQQLQRHFRHTGPAEWAIA